jgi:hypothetical protein
MKMMDPREYKENKVLYSEYPNKTNLKIGPTANKRVKMNVVILPRGVWKP